VYPFVETPHLISNHARADDFIEGCGWHGARTFHSPASFVTVPTGNKRQRPDRIVMELTSRRAGDEQSGRCNLWLTMHLPASLAANIRGTSIAKSVISVEGDATTG
jgi:hypothetical protein